MRAGGTLVATPLLGSLDRDHVAPAETPPYLLKDLFGVERIEWSSLNDVSSPPKELIGKDPAMWRGGAEPGRLEVASAPDSGLRGPYTGHTWIDHLRAIGADCLATFTAGSPAGEAPAITVHAAGAGKAVYIASFMEARLYEDLIALLLGEPEADVRPAERAAIEIVRCNAGDQPVYYVLNHDLQPHTVNVDGVLYDALADREASGSDEVPGYGVALLIKQITST